MEVQETRVQTDRVLTIPNILSMARLVGVPVFLWLILRPEFGGPKSDGWALLVLAFSGVSDYLDGKLARRWNQISSLGRLLDPGSRPALHSLDPGRAHLAGDSAALVDGSYFWRVSWFCWSWWASSGGTAIRRPR